MDRRICVGVTRDLRGSDGRPILDIGLEALAALPEIEWEFLPEEQLEGMILERYDALFLEAPRLTASALEGVERLRLVARFGVGYDNVDVAACTRRGILVTNTPDGVRRPMAVAALTFVLALSQEMVAKDRLTREGRWSERGNYTGLGLEGRTVGVIGLGNIGRELMRLIAPFGMHRIAYDPYADVAVAAALGVGLVDLAELMRGSDFVVVACALTSETEGLLDAGALALMKREAYVINIARGGVIDQAALTRALTECRIRGAGLDVLAEEPIREGDPLLSLDNVVMTAHAIGWTDHCFRDCGISAWRSIIDIASRRVPAYLVNPEVLDHPRARELLVAGRAGSSRASGG